MIKHILDLDYNKNEQLSSIFKIMAEGETILLLGAGASVTPGHRFLSADVMEFFENKKGISWGIRDITEFVDVMSSHTDFTREEFDNFTDECLRKYKISDVHKAIARVNWRIIISTNYDLLIENAFAEIDNTHEEINKLKVVHNLQQYYGHQARNELKYVKLNGCISDRRKYPLVFSTDDFKRAEKFYKGVLNDLRNLSDRINFLSIGYSYSDDFAKQLLQKIDSNGFRQRRVLYNVDPYINDATLPNFAERGICIIKATAHDFFQKYHQWLAEKEFIARKSSRNYFTNDENADVIIPTNISRRIGDNLKQLNSHYRSRQIPDVEYYKGEDPNYEVVLRNYDVKKISKLEQVETEIFEIMETKLGRSRTIPLFLLTGTFGTGKSTFAYRLLNKINLTRHCVSFEIFDPSELNAIDLKEIFSKCSHGYVFIYVNAVEINTIFKSLLELRNKLSIEISPEQKVVFIATVREHLYSYLIDDKQIKNSFPINIDCPFSPLEAAELVEKLKNSGVLMYRDSSEKSEIVSRILSEFSGDSYVSLMEIVQGSKFVLDLLETYHQLSDKGKKAFIFTSLLYQYKIAMPSGLLCSLVSAGDWNNFKSEVLERDGRGILIQDVKNTKGAEPDLYFRTKHPIISGKLIQEIVQDEEVKFNYVKSIITHTVAGYKISRLVINLLKALYASKDLSYAKIDTLYDLADAHLNNDPYFLLHYAINLQRRGSEKDLETAISKITYAESVSERRERNHYLIHRRGVLTFELAKLVYSKKNVNEFYKVLKYLNEARDFLEIKRALDPYTAYSYCDLLILEIWCLEKLEEMPADKLKRRLKIEELFDVATSSVGDYISRVYEIQAKYISQFKYDRNDGEYLEFLEQYYENVETRPYAILLQFNFYLEKQMHVKCLELLPELEETSYNFEVVKVLFKYYSTRLSDHQIRIRFFQLLRSNSRLEENEYARVHYFSFIAECYNRNFRDAHEHLVDIRSHYHHLNTEFHQVWQDENGEVKLFEAKLKMRRTGKKQFYIAELHQWITCENWNNTWSLGMNFDVEIHFYVYGLRATAINIISDDYEEDEHDEDETVDL